MRKWMYEVDVDGEVWRVEVSIDLDSIVSRMGKRAVRSKSGKSRDGFVLVKRAGRVPGRPERAISVEELDKR